MTCLQTRRRKLIAHDFVRCRCRLASPRGGRRAMELFFRYEIPIELWDGEKGPAEVGEVVVFGVEMLKCVGVVINYRVTHRRFLFGGWALFKNVSPFFPLFFAFFLKHRWNISVKTLLKPPFSLKHLTNYKKILIDSRIDVVSMNDFLGEVVIFHKPPHCKSMLIWEHHIFLIRKIRESVKEPHSFFVWHHSTHLFCLLLSCSDFFREKNTLMFQFHIWNQPPSCQYISC